MFRNYLVFNLKYYNISLFSSVFPVLLLFRDVRGGCSCRYSYWENVTARSGKIRRPISFFSWFLNAWSSPHKEERKWVAMWGGLFSGEKNNKKQTKNNPKTSLISFLEAENLFGKSEGRLLQIKLKCVWTGAAWVVGLFASLSAGY